MGKGYRSINVRLRQGLDLYASVRPVRTLPGVKVPFDNVDLVVVRENTEGLYAGLEHVVVPGVVESLRVITRPAAATAVISGAAAGPGGAGPSPGPRSRAVAASPGAVPAARRW